MKRLVLLTFIFSIFQISAYSQADYKTSIGVRGAPASGITLKHYMTERAAFEGILTTRWEGFVFTGLYELTQVAFGSEKFNFYYGAGAHVGYWDDNPDHPWFDDDSDYVIAGLDGIIGLEFVFESIPFNLSLDWKPAFNIINYTGFWADEIGLSLRYYW
jgi:hypothetical protein